MIKKIWFSKSPFAQFIRFGIVGVSNTAISYLIYSVTLLMFHRAGLFPDFDYLVAQMIQFVLSVLWSFFWNNRIVFRKGTGEKRSIWKSLLKTYISYSITGLFLSSALLSLWIEMFHIDEFIAPLINLVITVPLNFLLNKFWAFRTSSAGKEQTTDDKK